MSTDYVRYAIWWVPEEATPLAAFGKRWTGWCGDEGCEIDPGATEEVPAAPVSETCEIALRGLHGTLAAPFTLGLGRTVWRLQQALSELVTTMPSVPVPRLDIVETDGRVELAPSRESGMLERLQGRIADLVHLISGARTQTPEDDSLVAGGVALPIRAAHAPGPAERFVLPLTGRMSPRGARLLIDELQPCLAPVLPLLSRITDLALMGDPGEGRRWRLLERYRLADEPMSARGKIPASMLCAGYPMPPLNAVMGSDWDTVIA